MDVFEQSGRCLDALNLSGWPLWSVCRIVLNSKQYLVEKLATKELQQPVLDELQLDAACTTGRSLSAI